MSGNGRGPAEKGVHIANKLSPLRHALTVVAKNADPSLVTQDLVGDKPCLVTVDTGEYVTGEIRHHRRLARNTVEPTSEVTDGVR
jgi:hypothetical protein